MILEQRVLPFLDWITASLPLFVICAIGLALSGLFLGFLFSAVRDGPAVALHRTGATLLASLRDLRDFSVRRTATIARLAVKESIRLNMIVAFIVFAIILMFAAWFLDVESDNPAKLLISFVVKLTNFLLIVLAIFLSTFSLPNDIKNRTFFTVATKPIRPWEVVIGRIAGFMIICSAILAMMCLVSYVFVRRGIAHSHVVDAQSVEMTDSGETRGRTSLEMFHRHDFKSNSGRVDPAMGHYHHVQADGDELTFSAPLGALVARVPIYGELYFLGRDGKPIEKGINVGKEWAYRGYIEGGSLGAGILRFDGLKSRDFPYGLPLEMTIRVYRTFQGEIERGIYGTLLLRNPNPALRGGPGTVRDDAAIESEEIPIVATEFTTDERLIPRQLRAKMPDGSWRDVDLFESLVHEGSIEVVIRCEEGAQYYGLARTDVYVRAADTYFWWNFSKCYLSIWLQLLIVVSLGVMFSTFLSGPVSMLATIGSILMGYFSPLIVTMISGETAGGPGVAFIRMIKQLNQQGEIGRGIGVTVLESVDSLIVQVMRVVSLIMPNFTDFAESGGMNTTRFVASGFDIPANIIGQHATIAVAYFLVAVCIGYFFLKTREIAA